MDQFIFTGHTLIFKVIVANKIKEHIMEMIKQSILFYDIDTYIDFVIFEFARRHIKIYTDQ